MLASPRKQSEPNDEEAAKIDAGLIDELSDLFTMHHMPIVVLGSGRTTLRDKWAAIMHAFLEAGGTFLCLRHFADSFATMTSDFGVEFGLTAVKAHPITDSLHWYPRELLLRLPQFFIHMHQNRYRQI